MRHILPPDDLQNELLEKIKPRLEPGLTLSFYRVQDDEKEDLYHGVVYGFGPSRKMVERRDAFFDPASIIKDMIEWRDGVHRKRERYTLEPPEERWA